MDLDAEAGRFTPIRNCGVIGNGRTAGVQELVEFAKPS
jgi:hypothetical protein